MQRPAWLASFAVALLGTLLLAQPSEHKRRALVIGNDDYKAMSSKVPLATEDALEMRQSLKALGFESETLLNVKGEALRRGIDEFLKSLQSGDVGVFYFVGHGVQDKGDNWLLPIDFSLANSTTEDMGFRSYSLARVVQGMEKRKLSLGLVILETGQSNPGLDRRFDKPGLTVMTTEGDALVITLATRFDRAVTEVPNATVSRFTQAWVTALRRDPYLPLSSLLNRVREQVRQATNGQQDPDYVAKRLPDFIFDHSAAPARQWETLKNSTDLKALEAFRLRYESDTMAADAAAARIRSVEWQHAREGGTDAVRLYLRKYPNDAEARRMIEGAQVPTPAAPKPAPLAQPSNVIANDSSLVLDAVERYRKAYADRSIDALQAAWPSMGESQRKRLQDSFRDPNLKSMRFELTALEAPLIQGGTATVKCRRIVQMTMGRNSPPTDQRNVVVRLIRKGDGWVVDAVVVE